jgi:putative membrane protein
MRKLATGASVSLLAVSALGAAAVDATAATKPSRQDIGWMKSNAQTDLAEISAGKLVLMKTSNSGTRKLARVTESQHQAVLRKLRSMAKQLGVTLPTTPSQQQLQQASLLKRKTGLVFDKKYDQLQIAGHKQSISQTRTEITKGSSAPVVSFAKHYLPVAQMHLKMAERLERQLGS